MATIEDRWKKRFYSGLKIFSLGTMLVGAVLLLAAFPSKRGKRPFRSF